MSEQTEWTGLSFTIGDRLRKAREWAGLEQEQLAAEIDISRGTVSNYERGETQPKKLALKAWAIRCGVPLSYLEAGTLPTGDDRGPSTNVRTMD